MLPRRQALWLHYRLAPGEQEQLLRVFAPDLSGLDLYALEGDNFCVSCTTGARPNASPTLRGSDHVLPLPNSSNRWTSTCAWSPNTSCAGHQPGAAAEAAGSTPAAVRPAVRRPDADHAQPDPLPYTRSSTTLILALYHGLMLLSGLILLNLSGPWWHVWHSAQTPAAYLTLVWPACPGCISPNILRRAIRHG
jgi:hypothetical protein